MRAVLAFSVAGLGHAGAGSEEGWTVDTEDCSDPDRANAPIEGTISIGSAMPLSGGAAAAAFEPAARGFQAYIDYANANDLLPGYELALTIGDDQYDPALTPGVVNGLIDDGVHLFAGIIGTQNNLAVRDTLNEECIPQLNLLAGDPRFGEVADYPWTTGLLTSYEYEFGGYAQSIVENFPDSTIGLFYVNNEFGNVSIDNFRAAADEAGLEIVERADDRARRRGAAAGAAVEPRRGGPGHHRRRAARGAVHLVPQRAGQRQGRFRRVGAGRLHDQHVRGEPADPRRRRRERQRHLQLGGDGPDATSPTPRSPPSTRSRRTSPTWTSRGSATSSPPAPPGGTPAR